MDQEKERYGDYIREGVQYDTWVDERGYTVSRVRDGTLKRKALPPDTVEQGAQRAVPPVEERKEIEYGDYDRKAVQYDTWVDERSGYTVTKVKQGTLKRKPRVAGEKNSE